MTRTLGNGQSFVQQYNYNNAGQVTLNQTASNGIAAYAGYQYNKDGQLALISRSSSLGSNTVATLYYYSSLDGRLQKVEHIKDPGHDTAYNSDSNTFTGTAYDVPLCRLSYAYDAEGNILSRSRQFFNGGAHQRTAWQSFAHDKLGRLIGESYDLNNASAQERKFARFYTYDLAGNRTQKRAQDGTVSYSYDTLHQITSENGSAYSYTHDTLGNLTGIGGGISKTLTWNIAGNLVQVGGVQYTYDDSGTGLLAERKVGIVTTKYFWEGYNLFLEKLSNTPLKVYFNHPGGAAGTICRLDLGDGVLDYSDEVYIYLHDEAGNVIGVTDKYGYLAVEYEQDVWGNDLIGNFGTPVNGAAILQHQSGKVWDAEAGMYYNGARWYDPRLGRFVSRSPLAPEGEEEYAFCGNDPVNWVDVNGWEQISSSLLLGNPVHQAISEYYFLHLLQEGFENIRFDEYLTDYDCSKISNYRPDISADKYGVRYFWEIKSLYDDQGYSQLAQNYLSPFQRQGNEAYPGPRLPEGNRIPFPHLSPTAYIRAFPGRLPGIIQYTIHDDGPKRLLRKISLPELKDIPIILPAPMPFFRVPVFVP